MTERDRILVIGGTRGTGYELVTRLLRERRPVRVLARDPERARERLGAEVEVVGGDVTRPETLTAAMSADLDAIVLTAAVTRRVAGSGAVRATVLDGTRHTLAAARAAGFAGRFVYLSALGTRRRSWLGMLLNLKKGRTLHWRRLAEEAIRASGLDYTIVHAGILTDEPSGVRALHILQEDLPLLPRYRVGRGDVAEVLLRALAAPGALNATFDLVAGEGPSNLADPGLLAELQADVLCGSAAASRRVDARIRD